MSYESDITTLVGLLNTAISGGNIEALYGIMDQIARLQGGDSGSTMSHATLKDFFQTHNYPLSPTASHGDQCVQKAVWQLPGSVCGRATVVPRYYQIRFDWGVPDPFQTFDTAFEGKEEFKVWFKDILVKRGPLILPPFPTLAEGVEDEAGQYGEALQQRFEAEYAFAYWKRSINPASFRPGTNTPDLNAAWFLWYGPLPAAGSSPEPVLEPSFEHDSDGADGWMLGIIENTRVKATSEGASSWNNSYSPLLLYKLVPRGREPYDVAEFLERPALFKPIEPNEFEIHENNISLPLHLAILEPFYP